jgi:hypothetical protein
MHARPFVQLQQPSQCWSAPRGYSTCREIPQQSVPRDNLLRQRNLLFAPCSASAPDNNSKVPEGVPVQLSIPGSCRLRHIRWRRNVGRRRQFASARTSELTRISTHICAAPVLRSEDLLAGAGLLASGGAAMSSSSDGDLSNKLLPHGVLHDFEFGNEVATCKWFEAGRS